MAKKSKLELLLELGDKLFNSKLSQVQDKLNNAADKMTGRLKKFDVAQIKIFSKFGDALDPTKINQAFELFDKASSKLDFTKDINKTKVALRQMGVENVDEVSSKVHQLSRVFDDDSLEIAKAANAMTKQIGGSFDENLALLEAGYEKGANLNGDMLDQFKEYSAKIRESGLSASEAMAIMAHAGKSGMFSDKAIDSIKEATQSINEIGQPQIDALKGIGLEYKQFAGKTAFEAVKMISKAMDGATTQAKQLVMADIFKGAGEDGGMAFLEGLNTMDLDPNNIESFQKADAGLNTWLAKFESKVADTMGNLPVQDIANFSMTIMGLAGAYASWKTAQVAAAGATDVLTTKQWSLNAAMAANPIGAIVVVIAALIALVVLAIKKWDDWGAAITVFLGPIGVLISAFKSVYDHWESIKKAFTTEGFIKGLQRLNIVLIDALLKPIQKVLEILADFDPTGLAQKQLDRLKAFREANNLVTPGEKEAQAKTEPTAPKIKPPVSPLINAPVLDGVIVDPNKNKDKDKTDGDVNKVAGQAKQVRNVEIKIDAFNKGGINVAQSAYAGMSKDDVEAWFKEMLRRVLINAETVGA